MELQWWQDWTGWLITTGLAGVAAGVAIMQEIRHHRSQPNAALWFERTGELNLINEVTGEPQQWERFRVSNVGTGYVRLYRAVIFGAKPEYPDGDSHHLPRTFAPGEERNLVVVPGRTHSAWVLLVAAHPHRKGWVKVWWQPLEPGGPLLEKLRDSRRVRRRLQITVARLIRRQVIPVGPDGRREATMRFRSAENLPEKVFPPTAGGYPLVS
ncbi:hypothetical protein ACFT2C_04495 [Promicromonospora sp. NPDC057138]|uniref:hypothetical protein n=1 Tax=Promicromonospora sp. NPDC057138 TaxID=3346031 RepID=UPI0036293391